MSVRGVPAEMPEMTEMDFSACPEYYVTAGLTLPTGDGNTRFYAWVMKGNVAVPLYTAVSPAMGMILMSRNAAKIAESAFNHLQLVDRRGKGH